ncbi:MAG: glycosyltransferase [Bacteroidaceae bacterium]|nr:glycosyltransferase [Bacteroidaceae bacterium]
MTEGELTYSIAIRTLGKNPDVLKQELESIMRQTVQPQKVIVYIAEGYDRPDFCVGTEQYVWVKKGMVAQRVLEYHEIDSDVILMLDDDVELADNSAEKLLGAMVEYQADVVAADTFKNQDMSPRQKMMAFLTNAVYARKDDGWAFKLDRNGSFSYNGTPKKPFCWTETFSGPCWMTKKSVLKTVRLDDELWLDRMGFPYGEDAVESYKFFLNGYRCGVLYDSGVKNLDAKTSSGTYHKSDRMFYTRSFGMFATWWRMIYQSRDKRWLSAWLYVNKSMWQLFVHLCLGLVKLNLKIPYNYVKGFSDGWKYVHSEEFRALPPYIIRK